MTALPVANIAANLPELCLAERSFSAAERVYLAFYGLQFAEEFPQLVHSFGVLESGAEKLAVQVWQQPGAVATILLVHGYFDHVGLFGHLVRYGLARGYNVVAFDLPGHGLSSGEAAIVDDFEHYRLAIADILRFIAKPLGKPHVIAQSTGAGVMLDYLLRGDATVQKIVLLAPLVRPRGWWWVGPAQVLLQRFRDSVPRKLAENSTDAAFLEFIRRDPLQSKIVSLRWVDAMRRWQKSLPEHSDCSAPILLIQGDADETVDWRYNVERIQQLVPTIRVEYIRGARHHLPNESPPLRERVFALIDEFLDEGAGHDDEGLHAN